MTALCLHHNRPWRLAAMASALRTRAGKLAKDGEITRALHAVALAEALHWLAGGDEQGARIALSEARFYAKAKRRKFHA